MTGRTCIPVSIRRDTEGKKTSLSSEENSAKRGDGSRSIFTTTCRLRLPSKSPAKYLKHLGDKVITFISYMSTKTRSSTKVSSASTSKPCVTPIDSRREEAISDCIEFINASATLPRSNSVSS